MSQSLSQRARNSSARARSGTRMSSGPIAVVTMNRHSDEKHLSRMRVLQKHLSKGVMDVTVLVNPSGKHFHRVIQALEIINAAQAYYRLKPALDVKGEILAIDDKIRSADMLRKKIVAKFSDALVIAMTEHDLSDDGVAITISERPGCTIISCDDWTEVEGAPPTRVYLVYQMASALTTFSACLTAAENDMMTHQDEGDENEEDDDENLDFLKGCLFDYWVGAKPLYRSMVSARLCPQCRSGLLAHGAPVEAVNATEKLLDWIRSVILERQRKLPKNIFIGHGGKSAAWHELGAMLKDWKLDVEEFNEEPAAGVSVTERLKSMLENSRFAFLVMTGENTDDKGRVQARLNVIHEIGLFQGRLGTECAIVLREKPTSTFSNLDGITRIDFDKDRIGVLRPEVHRLLIARGIIPADTPLNRI